MNTAQRIKHSQNLSVADRRAAAQALGVSMSDYKAGNWDRTKEVARQEKQNAIANTPKAPRMAGDAVFNYTKAPTTNDKSAQIARLQERQERRENSGSYDQAKYQNTADRLVALREKDAMAKSFDGSDINTYDFGGVGTKRAGLNDVQYLAERGFSARDIDDAITKSGAKRGGSVNALLAKYMQPIMTGKPNDDVSDPILPTTPIVEIDTGTDVTVPPVAPVPVTPGPGPGPGPYVPPIQPVTVSDDDNTATGVIMGDTGDISLVDSNNYGTINTGIINDIRDYGGGYNYGENNTGLAQAYIDQMQENWEDYSGPGYGMYITDSRIDKANETNPIDTNSIYGSMGNFAQNFYDRGLIASSGLYGDQYKFSQPTYGGFPTFG
jgi:hypothetical protein